MEQVLRLALAAVVAGWIVNQCRRPMGWPGRLMLSNMNRRHSGVTDWGLTHVSIAPQDTILDIGCGGGATIHKLAAVAAAGKVYGVDYSGSSVAASRGTNRDWIEKGRVDVRQASVSALPFPDATFDLVTAVETHYYWPNLERDMREVLRVLKPGGTFLLIAEAYRGRRFDGPFRLAMMLLRATYLTIEEHRELFSKAGFENIEIFEERSKGWVCGAGRRPARPA